MDTMKLAAGLYQYTFVDDCTRYLVAALYPPRTAAHTLAFFKALDKGLSTTTVHHLHGAFHKALSAALRLDLVPRNVTEMVSPPRRRHHEMMPLSKEQARALLAAVSGDRFEAVYVLALSTGMREGELFALEWKDIDWKLATLQVRASVQEKGSQFIISEPKTTYSRRRIGLTPMALDALRRHKERLEAEKALLGAAWVLNMIWCSQTRLAAS